MPVRDSIGLHALQQLDFQSPRGCQVQTTGQKLLLFFYIQQVTCIQMKTNKPSFGTAVLDISQWILRKHCQN